MRFTGPSCHSGCVAQRSFPVERGLDLHVIGAPVGQRLERQSQQSGALRLDTNLDQRADRAAVQQVGDGLARVAGQTQRAKLPPQVRDGRFQRCPLGAFRAHVR